MKPNPFRILIVDDNPAIHADFRKILCPDRESDQELASAEADFFGDQPVKIAATNFQLDFARQGQEGLELVSKAQAEGRPYALAFVDVRMPPGWDGVETTTRLWEVNPDLQVVICTAYSDYDLGEMTARFSQSDRFVILKKPFDAVEARQLANAFTRKWELLQQERRRQEQVKQTMSLRTAELLKSEERYRILFESSPVPAWVYETKLLRILAVNNAALQTYGYTREEFLSKTLRDIRADETVSETAAKPDSRPPAARHDRHRKKDGSLMDVQISAYPVNFQGWEAELMLAEDVTGRKQTESALRLKTSALEAAANGVVITDRGGIILWINQAFTQLTGYSAAEAVGQKMSLLKSGAHDTKFYEVMWWTILNGCVWHGEITNKRKNGSVYCEEMTITPVQNAAGEITHFVAIKMDISQRKQFEQALARERDLLQALTDNIPDAIYFKDRESRFVRCSQTMVRQFGYEHMEDVAGRTDFDFFDEAHAREAYEDEQRIIQTGDPMVGKVEREFWRADGRESWALTTKMPLRNEAGTIIGTFGVSRDITALKVAERNAQIMEVQLRQSQKLEAIGQLAAGIAHEINTPTQYVGDNTRFLKDSFASIAPVLHSHKELLAAIRQNTLTPEQVTRAEELLQASDLDYLFEQIPAAVRETLEGVERVTKIIRAMKEFSHPGVRERAAADLNKAIETTVTVARNEWKYVADLDLDLEPNLPLVPCFIGEFNQAILNLVVNAAHAIGDVVKAQPGSKGRITIRTRRDGGQVEVRVRDTGTGIPEAVRPRIFEPFFTTKDVGKGTGQGLSIIYGSIVKKHGGTVTFETETGQGTTFILRLPITLASGEAGVTGQATPELIKEAA